jgi:hypothetical protein
MITNPRHLRRICQVLVAGVCLALPAGAQTPARVATTVEAMLAEPVFFHGRQVAVRAGATEERGVTRLVAPAAAGTTATPRPYPVFVFWRQSATRSEGEIRGEFWDIGRLREDDSRFTSYDLRPILEIASNGRWPARDQVFVLLGASIVDAPEPTSPSLRAIAVSPARFADRGVTITGRFRGRNLFGDLPSAPNLSRWDFVLQSADAALWVTGLRPKGNDFELDLGTKIDTSRWVEITGMVHVEGSKVWVQGESIKLTRQPANSEPEPPPPPVIKAAPPSVIFTAPLADEVDVPTDTSVRMQFSRDMDARTLRGRVRVSYVQTGAATPLPATAPDVTIAYNEANRALEVKFSRPLDRFQTVKIDLLEGIAAPDGQMLAPWSMTFSTGAR